MMLQGHPYRWSLGAALMMGGSLAAIPAAASAQVPTTLPNSSDPAAQNPPPAGSALESSAAPQASGSAEQTGNGLGDIVVTAQRRSERLQDVPAAISAFNDRQLALAGVQSTRDLQIITPSLTFVQASFAPQPTIRGIGTRNVNPGDEQVVPIYLDGVYQPFIVGGIFELNNVDRIEVLKGPQGTLLGRNATGGAINILTLAPSFEPEGKLSVGYGSFNERQASGYVSAGTGPIAASLTAQYLQDDGYVREQITGRRIAAVTSVTIRGKVLLKPTDHTEITLAASYSNRDDTTSLAVFPYRGNTQSTQGNPGLVLTTSGRQSRLNFFPSLTISQNAISANIVQHLGSFDLNSITGYSENVLDYRADVDATTVATTNQVVHQYERGVSEDLFLSSTGSGPFSWVVGGFYFDDRAGFSPRLSGTTITNTRATTKAYAAYAQGTYAITDALSLTAGGRYSNDRKCASANNGIGTRVLPNGCTTWDSFDPTGTIDYRVTAGTKVYLRYAQAFKSGVYNAASFSAVPVSPEKVRSYELGIKSDPLPWLRVNAAGFYTDYDNIQVNTRDPITTAVILQNAASARIYGVEGDIFIRPVERFNIRLSASQISARYRDFLNAQIFSPRVGGGNVAQTINASGLRLVRTPQTTASVSADYTAPLAGGKLTFSGNVFYQGDLNWQIDGRLRQPDYAMINGQIAWRTQDERYEIALWGKNLTNVQLPLSLITSTVNDQASYMRPATVGVRLSGRF